MIGGYMRRKSGMYARERLHWLILSERMECSPETLMHLKKDLIHTAKKYFEVEDQRVILNVKVYPAAVTLTIPLQNKRDTRRDTRRYTIHKDCDCLQKKEKNRNDKTI